MKILYTLVESSVRIQPGTKMLHGPRKIGLTAGIVRNLGKVCKAKDISKAAKVESTLVPDLDPVSYFLQRRNLDTEGRTKVSF